jgi:hypothetical protein
MDPHRVGWYDGVMPPPLDAETVAIRAFLLEQYPRDVLAPSGMGRQYALLHRPGAWTWSLSDAYVQSVERVGIFLDSLCVIETASAAASDEIESMYPVLVSAPADVDTTSGGRHYFLTCSERVQREGFVERTQRPPQISRFFTVGELVELPKTVRVPGIRESLPAGGGKRVWLRHLTKGRAPVIPDALLFDAAKPRHLTEAFVVFFIDGTQQSYPNGAKGLRELGYFQSAIEGRWGAGAGASGVDGRLVLRVPAEATTSPALFDELLFVLAEGELSLRQSPTQELVVALAAAARYLAAPLSVLELLSTSPLSRVYEQVDLYNISPSFSICVAAEAAARREGGVTEALLIPINAEVARTLLYKPILQDSRCLLPDAEAPSNDVVDEDVRDAGGLVLSGERVLEADPSSALKKALPRAVIDILSRYKHNVILAGGAVTGGVFFGGLKFNDCDLFIHSVEEDGANTIVDFIERDFAATYDIVRRIQAVTFTPKTGESLPFQIILSLFHNRAEVIAGFDLAPCKALARVFDGELIIEAMPAWRESLRRLAFWADSGCWSSSACPRIYKYLGRGFDCFVPGTQRSLFVQPDELPGSYKPNEAVNLTWGGLFTLEKKLVRLRVAYAEQWRVSSFEAERIGAAQKRQILSPSAYEIDDTDGDMVGLVILHPSIAARPAGTPRQWWFVDPRSPHPLLRHPMHARKELLYRPTGGE